jgi:hypothetical protein
VLSSAP